MTGPAARTGAGRETSSAAGIREPASVRARWPGAGCGALVVSAGLAAVCALLSLGIGAVWLDPATVARALAGSGDPVALAIVRDIRLPRTLLAVMIGFTLGLSGAALQGLLRNPLASPALFGAPSAASFGATVVIGTGLAGALSFGVPVAAILGAFLSVFLLLVVAGRNASLTLLILAGLAVSSLASAATSLALNLAPNPFAALEIAFWLLGSLDDRSMRHVLLAAPFMLVSWGLLIADRMAFRALALGEEAAESLGVRVGAVRLRVVAAVAAGVGAGVAVSGGIGFVGLVAPHMVRPFVRHDPARLMLPAGFAGAALLTAADILTRLIPTSGEPVKVGVVTALIGVPVFLLVLVRERRTLETGR